MANIILGDNDVHLSFPKGQVTFIYGERGVGLTTLLSTLIQNLMPHQTYVYCSDSKHNVENVGGVRTSDLKRALRGRWRDFIFVDSCSTQLDGCFDLLFSHRFFDRTHLVVARTVGDPLAVKIPVRQWTYGYNGDSCEDEDTTERILHTSTGTHTLMFQEGRLVGKPPDFVLTRFQMILRDL